MLIFKKEYDAKGWFEECMDDSCPDIGSYTRNISMHFKKNQLLEGNEVKHNVFKLDDSPYGVSLHGSSAFISVPVDLLLKEGVLKEISDDDALKLRNLEEAKREYYEASYETQQLQDYIKENPGNVTEQCIETFVSLILSEIHAKAEFIMAS